MEESKSISRPPGYYHWVTVTFFIIIIIIITVIIITIIVLFIYLSTFIRAQSVLQRCSPEWGVLRMCWGFPGMHLYMGVILLKLQSGFVEIALLCWCSPVGLLHVWGHLPWITPPEDCF